MPEFNCRKCGKCCRNIDLLVPELDRGDGVCEHYNDNSKLCMIYETRPFVCRVDEVYKRHYKDKMTVFEYYKIQDDMCKNFRRVR